MVRVNGRHVLDRVSSKDKSPAVERELTLSDKEFRELVALVRASSPGSLPQSLYATQYTGLHIQVPLARRYTHEECRTFARLLAMLGQEAKPEISTLARPLHARGGKVYIDWGQNGHGNTIAAPYALRPLPCAPASCPLEWREVNRRLDPARFNLRTLPKRFERMADPLLGVLGEGVDMGSAIVGIEERLKRGKGRS